MHGHHQATRRRKRNVVVRRPEQVGATKVETREGKLLAQRIHRRISVFDLHVSRRAEVGETPAIAE